MNNVRLNLKDLLHESEAITAIVARRIYHLLAPEGIEKDETSYIIYGCDQIDPDETHDTNRQNETRADLFLFSVEVIAEDSTILWTLAEEVVKALDGQSASDTQYFQFLPSPGEKAEYKKDESRKVIRSMVLNFDTRWKQA